MNDDIYQFIIIQKLSGFFDIIFKEELLSDEGIEDYLLQFYLFSQYLQSENLWKNTPLMIESQLSSETMIR